MSNERYEIIFLYVVTSWWRVQEASADWLTGVLFNIGVKMHRKNAMPAKYLCDGSSGIQLQGERDFRDFAPFFIQPCEHISS